VDISEDELITAIGRVLSGTGPDVLVPVGDDAAVVRGGAGDLVLTTDALVEGTHFDRAMSRPRDIGYKAIAASISDIAAMAASPRYALCALTLSDDVDAGWAMELFGGMREASDEFACTLVGGNLARGPEVTVAITLTGEVARGAAVRRSGAKPGDAVVVTGTLGGAAAGRRLARRGAPWTEEELDAIHHHERPAPRVVGSAGARTATRHGDDRRLGRGSRAIVRICGASGVGVRLDPATVPRISRRGRSPRRRRGLRAARDDALGSGGC
jgi:thiamine-monophosphate kinase